MAQLQSCQTMIETILNVEQNTYLNQTLSFRVLNQAGFTVYSLQLTVEQHLDPTEKAQVQDILSLQILKECNSSTFLEKYLTG